MLMILGFLMFAHLPQEAPPTAPKTAAEEASAEAGERARKRGTDAAAMTTVTLALRGANPISLGANFLTGMISAEIQSKVASSKWAMSNLQKGAADAIQKFLSKREKEPYSVTNSKFEGLIILTISASGITKEKADSILKEEPLWKWRKCGWDRLIFTNGAEAWAFSTEGAKPK